MVCGEPHATRVDVMNEELGMCASRVYILSVQLSWPANKYLDWLRCVTRSFFVFLECVHMHFEMEPTLDKIVCCLWIVEAVAELSSLK